MSVPIAPKVPVVSALTAQDRCDRCGGRATTQAFLHGLVLLFCRHHSEMFMTKLVEIADEITVDTAIS